MPYKRDSEVELKKTTDMSFEIYRASGRRRRLKQYISVTGNETFGLPRPFLDAQGITEDMRAVILYDQAENAVAIKFITSSPEFAYKLKFSSGDNAGAVIVAKDFFFDMKLDASKYKGRYDFKKMPMAELGLPTVSGSAFVIELKESKSEVVADDAPEGINLDDIPF